MLMLTLNLASILIALALLMNLISLLKGPSLPERILALDTLYINSIALIVVRGIQFNIESHLDAALLIALMGFVGTVAVSKYLLRGDIIE